MAQSHDDFHLKIERRCVCIRPLFRATDQRIETTHDGRWDTTSPAEKEVTVHTGRWTPATIQIETEGNYKYLGATYDIERTGIDQAQLQHTAMAVRQQCRVIRTRFASPETKQVHCREDVLTQHNEVRGKVCSMDITRVQTP